MPKVQINYKSGNSVKVEVATFVVTEKSGKIETVELKQESWHRPNFMFLNVDAIESIWEL